MTMHGHMIALSGSTGFLGREVVKALTSKDIPVRLLVHSKVPPLDVNVEQFSGDLVTGNGLDAFMDGADILINVAGRFELPFSEQLKLNCLALDNLCKSAVKHNVAKIIHISGSAVYGSCEPSAYAKETDALIPDTLYGLSKKLGEEVIRYYAKNYALNFVIFRPPNIYGPGSDHGVVHQFLNAIKENKVITVYGDGRHERDFLYVEDMVSGILKAIDFAGSAEFNIGSGTTSTLIELIGLLEHILHRSISTVHKKPQSFVVQRLAVDIIKARTLLQWKPKTSLRTGLQQTISAYFS